MRGHSFPIKVFDRSRSGCQGIGEGARNDFRGPLVQALPLPSRVSLVRPVLSCAVISKCLPCRLLKFRLQTWQNGSFGNSFLLCFCFFAVIRTNSKSFKRMKIPLLRQKDTNMTLGNFNRLCGYPVKKPQRDPRSRVY